VSEILRLHDGHVLANAPCTERHNHFACFAHVNLCKLAPPAK